MKTLIVIPARYASTRLPGKPLLRSTGKYLVQHVYERACMARCAQQVVVATDDPRVSAAVASFGGQAVMTSRECATGTDRVAEVARQIDADIYVNLQGDEPLVDVDGIDRLVETLESEPDGCLATLAAPIRDMETLNNPNCVKVICDNSGRALYFSRSAIPFVRDDAPDFDACPPRFLQHVGMYAFHKADLFALTALKPTVLENLEKLEQLRALHHGWSIAVGMVDRASRGVDTFEDYQQFVREYDGTRARLNQAA